MTAKQHFSTTYTSLITWAEDDLAKLDDETWLTPMKPGKWSIAEVLSHLIAWDRFVCEERIQHIQPGEILHKVSSDEQETNRRAAEYARAGISKEALIAEFKETRQKLIDAVDALSEAEFITPFRIGERELTIETYMQGMIHHDTHHRQEIDDFLANK
ncbi:DinB family protein [Brevibacillus dissolubilis]|uniref:DinB family protein n=1 Tax=Brevibacillus dissolubilis TaxID=1844116 RepID=UPI001116B2E2|nr:DinB family protein [Brevibacillus dissolubilis]